MDSAPRADRKESIFGATPSSERGEAAPVETARKSIVQPRVKRRLQESLKAHKRARLFNCLLFVVLAGVWFLFVQSLEGLDGDTTFLALFCAVLSMFIFKCLVGGTRHES